jgi:hypothetical protein
VDSDEASPWSTAYDLALPRFVARLDDAALDRIIALLEKARGAELVVLRLQIKISLSQCCARYEAHRERPARDDRSARRRTYGELQAAIASVCRLLEGDGRSGDRLDELRAVIVVERRAPVLPMLRDDLRELPELRDKLRELKELWRWVGEAAAKAEAPDADGGQPRRGPQPQPAFPVFLVGLLGLYERWTGKKATTGYDQLGDNGRTSPFIRFVQAVCDCGWPGERPSIGHLVHRFLAKERGHGRKRGRPPTRKTRAA